MGFSLPHFSAKSEDMPPHYEDSDEDQVLYIIESWYHNIFASSMIEDEDSYALNWLDAYITME